MGRLGAEAMAEQDIPLEAKLAWHLQSNHYPPVPSIMVPVCVKAITAANEDRWGDRLLLPAPVEYKGSQTAPVHAIVEQHHLESFLEPRDEY